MTFDAMESLTYINNDSKSMFVEFKQQMQLVYKCGSSVQAIIQRLSFLQHTACFKDDMQRYYHSVCTLGDEGNDIHFHSLFGL